MKKYFLWIMFALVSGSLLGKVTFDKYKKLEVENTFKVDTNIYALKDDMTFLDRYIYIQNENIITVYVALSKEEENIDKINDIYKKKDIKLIKESIIINNEEFIQNLSEYEKLLAATDDEKSLLIIENQILSCYEKLVVENE